MEPIGHREYLHGGVRTGTATRSREDLLKVNRSVEAEASIGKDVDPVALVVPGRVQDGDLREDAFAMLDPVISVARQPQEKKEVETLTSPACTKYPVTRRCFPSGAILT